MAWLEYIDTHQQDLIQRLADAVAIPSVSGEPDRRDECLRMVDWAQSLLESLHVQVKRVDIGTQTQPDGSELPLPPVLLGQLGSDPQKKTILVYGHLDVQPADRSDGWHSEPFQLEHHKESGQLRGRGSSDDKGPVLGWLNVIEAHQKTGTELPVNIKVCFECMEESGSEGLDEVVVREASGYFSDVDAVCISDNYWLNTRQPCLTYGLRGISYFAVTVSGPAADLHSGVFGGTIHEPMTDLFHLFSKLVSPKGKILVPGVNELVAPLTDEEKARYEQIDFSIEELESSIKANIALADNKADMLMARMRYPSLSIHGIEGAFASPGSKTVIPASVKGKFSIRLVPDMLPDKINKLVAQFLEAEFAKLGSKNTIHVELSHGGKPWVSDPTHWNFEAAAIATKKIYGVEPNYTREGGSIPVTLTFEEALKKSVMLLPMGRGDDGAHSINEKLDLSNYINGTKLLGTYLHEVSKLAR